MGGGVQDGFHIQAKASRGRMLLQVLIVFHWVDEKWQGLIRWLSPPDLGRSTM